MKAKTLLEFLKKDFKDFEQYVYFTKDMVETALEDINLLEEQNQGLQSLLDLKQQEISVLESKVFELEDSMDNSDEAIRRRYAKWAYPNEPKQN